MGDLNGKRWSWGFELKATEIDKRWHLVRLIPL